MNSLIKAIGEFRKALDLNSLDVGKIEVTLESDAWLQFGNAIVEHQRMDPFGHGQILWNHDDQEITIFGVTFAAVHPLAPSLNAEKVEPLPPVTGARLDPFETCSFAPTPHQMQLLDHMTKRIREASGIPAHFFADTGYAKTLKDMPEEECRKLREGDFVVFDEASGISEDAFAYVRPGSVTWVDFDAASPLGPRTDLEAYGTSPARLALGKLGEELIAKANQPKEEKPYADAFNIAKAMIEGGE